MVFAEEYCNLRRAPWGGWDYSGAKKRALPKLHRKLKELGMVRRLKEEVLHELPKKYHQVVPVEISNREEYTFAERDFLGWLKQTGGAHRARRAAGAERLARANYLRQLVARGKMRAIGTWVDNFLEETDEKLVLFCSHTKLLEALCRRYTGLCTHINGAVTGRHRESAKGRFIQDPDTRLLICNTLAAGVGVDGLQRVCRTAAFLELPWRPGDLSQAADRIYRIGQSDVTWIKYLIAPGTYEEKMLEILEEKQKNVRAVLDGGEGGDDISVLDMLLERMTKN
jgi:SNF2 family DNA or RNA helicase